jgi:hypothetical protein
MTPAYFTEPDTATPAPRRFSSIKPRTFAQAKAASARLRAKQKPPKKKAKKRDRNDPARIYGGKYADWIRSLPCVGCGYQGPAVEAAHTTTGGMGRKADAETLVPLCGPRNISHEWCRSTTLEGCHRLAHRVGHQKLEKVYRVDLKAKAAELWASWQKLAGSGAGRRDRGGAE